MGVYAAMSGGGAAIGLVAGGLLHHLPVLAVGAVRQRAHRHRRSRRGAARAPAGVGPPQWAASTWPGPSPAPAGVALLVYGLSNAGTDQRGISHWIDTKVHGLADRVGAAAAVTFVLIERRSRHRADAAAHLRQPQPFAART